MKEFRRPDVNGPDVEDTDAPVITREVSATSVAPAVSTLGSIVEAAFDAHAPQLKAFALAAVRDDDAADDLVQETFIRFVKQVRSNSVPDNVGGWLHRVCANLITSQGRRRSVANRNKPLLVDRTVGVSAEDRVIRMDEAAQHPRGAWPAACGCPRRPADGSRRLLAGGDRSGGWSIHQRHLDLHLSCPSPPARDPVTEQGSRAMTDHESFVLLAAKQLSEPLSSVEEDELAAHLAECPRCRSIAAGMRRDNNRLQAELGAAPVSPRVRARVLDETTGRRRIDSRLLLGLAAVLLLGVVGVPFIVGGRAETTPPPSTRAELPTLRLTPSPSPSSFAPSPSPASPVLSPSPSQPNRRSLPGRTCTAHDLHAAIPSQPSSRRVNRPVSGRESALLMGPGTHTRGQSRAS